MDQHENMVTKERLLNGVRQVETVETPSGMVRIRPLTKAERARVEAVALKGIKAMSHGAGLSSMEMDMEQLINNDFESQMIILACGLSVDENTRFTLKELKESTMDGDTQEILLKAIGELSGLSENTYRKVDNFRKVPGGEVPNPAP